MSLIRIDSADGYLEVVIPCRHFWRRQIVYGGFRRWLTDRRNIMRGRCDGCNRRAR